jgi:membrane-bound lytic murein transglycosylase D
MRLPTHLVFGFALFLSVVAGCAGTRYTNNDSQSLSWEQRSPATAPYIAHRQQGHASNLPEASHSAKAAAPTPKEFSFSHPRVDNFVTQFQTNLRSFFARALSRSGRYVPRMSSILEKKGLPQQLAYLPLIESGFSPQAVSRAGAVGPWQLIPGTGRRYGLRIDRYVDERRDPVKSTKAAANYLKDLHDMFGDWHLSLAAYNTGEQNIARILERKRAEDFWQMSERGYLYQETQDFVPEFLAALQIAESPQAYGFEIPSEEPVEYDSVKVDRSLSLSTVAQLTGASTKDIRELNPALHRGVVPPRGYLVRLPKGSKEAFAVGYANLSRSPAPRSTSRVHARRGHHGHRRHRVRRGETVASIAKQHGVSVRSVLSANGIRNPRNVRAGRTLRVPDLARKGEPAVFAAKNRSRAALVN